jgi:hypothetical protein
MTHDEKIEVAHRLVIQRIEEMRQDIDRFALRNIDNNVAWAEATEAYKDLAALEQIAAEHVERFRNR